MQHVWKENPKNGHKRREVAILMRCLSMKVYKYATGQEVPEGAQYLCTVKNGKMLENGYEFVWHYFLVK
jgi:hypothetical protein